MISACFPSANLAKSNKLLCTPLSLSPISDIMKPSAASAAKIYLKGEGFRAALSPHGHGRRAWLAFTLYKPLQLIALLSVCYLQCVNKYYLTPETDQQTLKSLAESLIELRPLLHNLWKLKMSLNKGTYFRTLPKLTSKLNQASEWAKTVPGISENLFAILLELVGKLELPKPEPFLGQNGAAALVALKTIYKVVSLRTFFEHSPLPPHNKSMKVIITAYPIFSVRPKTNNNVTLSANTSSMNNSTNKQCQQNSNPEPDFPALVNPYFTEGDNLELQIIENINRDNQRWVGDTPAHLLNTKHPLLKSLIDSENINACDTDNLIPKTATTILKRPAPAKKAKLSPLALATFGPNLKKDLQINISGQLYSKIQNDPLNPKAQILQ